MIHSKFRTFAVLTIVFLTRIATVDTDDTIAILEYPPRDSQLWANTKYIVYINNGICYKGWEVYLDH